MTLKNLMAEDLSIHLDTDEFAETIKYYPKRGAERDIVVTIQADDEVQIVNEAHHKIQEQTVEFLVRRDPVLGIDNPQLGDAIERIDNDWITDPKRKKFSFKRVSSTDDAAFVLEFKRSIPLRSGVQRQGEAK